MYVRFLPGSSLSPEEFLSRINARGSQFVDRQSGESDDVQQGKTNRKSLPKSAICITEYDSLEQLAADLAIMPGAGIHNVEVFPISKELALQYTPLGFAKEPV